MKDTNKQSQAVRPVFISTPKNEVNEKLIQFDWYGGFAKSQKYRSVESLHTIVKEEMKIESILEISTNSLIDTGINASAFNLNVCDKNGNFTCTLETAFQSAKVFEKGGPYSDLREKSSREAKQDGRLKNSGNIIKFVFLENEWELNPYTAFYDWLYISMLWNHNRKIAEEILQYRVFSDIAFNHKKSINCQARSAALFVSLYNEGTLDDALSSQDAFLKLHKSKVSYPNPLPILVKPKKIIQGTLL